MLTQSATVKNAFNPSALRNPPVESKNPVETTSDDESLARSMHVVGSVLYYPRRTAIIHEDDPADRLYKVISAAGHTLAAESITNVKVLVIRKSALAPLAKQSAMMTNELLELTARELARAQDRVLLLTSKSAQERVVGFLFEMSKRASSTGNTVELPMSRQDIADYLGLTIETVSRTLWALENCGAIEISTRRRIAFRNRSALMQLQQ